MQSGIKRSKVITVMPIVVGSLLVMRIIIDLLEGFFQREGTSFTDISRNFIKYNQNSLILIPGRCLISRHHSSYFNILKELSDSIRIYQISKP